MRELLLVKVSILGPEYLEDQLHGGPSHDPSRRYTQHPPPPSENHSKLERQAALAQNIENSAHPDNHHNHNHNHNYQQNPPPLTPSEALRNKHQFLHSISVLAAQFQAKILDVSDNSVIVELTAKTSRVEAFLSLLKPFGVLESARTGDPFPQVIFSFGSIDRISFFRLDGNATDPDREVGRRVGRRIC
jgi:acetolactate synthase-1/3 small subunit